MDTFDFRLEVLRGRSEHKQVVVSVENTPTELEARRAVLNRYLAQGYQVKKLERVYLTSGAH